MKGPSAVSLFREASGWGIFPEDLSLRCCVRMRGTDPMPRLGRVGGVCGVEPGVSHDSLLVVFCVSCLELAGVGGGWKG